MNAVATQIDTQNLDIEIRDGAQIIERTEALPCLSMREQVTIIGHELEKLPQTDLPLTHHFAPGLYLREIFMPADTIVIGRIHKTEHFNILVKGACLIVHDDGEREELRAPKVFVSKAGVQKVLLITEDMTWMTTHVSDETDVEKLEGLLTEPIPAIALENTP